VRPVEELCERRDERRTGHHRDRARHGHAAARTGRDVKQSANRPRRTASECTDLRRPCVGCRRGERSGTDGEPRMCRKENRRHCSHAEHCAVGKHLEEVALAALGDQ